MADPTLAPHRRYNPLTGEHVLVSPQRGNRPWQGAQERVEEGARPRYDPGCYLCPGNERVGGSHNPDYSGTYVFPNDFPAMLEDGGDPASVDGPFKREAAQGEARVICFSPDHSATLPELEPAQLRGVVDSWAAQEADLFARWRYVQLFENKGAAMGCSNPHPHGQVWATSFVPDAIATEDRQQRAWFHEHGRPLLLDTVAAELRAGERVVVDTAHWLAVVPFWAAWPFEALLLPKAPAMRLAQLGEERRTDLALALKQLTTRYDNLFETSFPYSMGWHGAPDLADCAHWQLHAHFYPPLLRSATVRKFMVGFEMLAEAQRDLTPESAAERLRAQSDVHYRSRYAA